MALVDANLGGKCEICKWGNGILNLFNFISEFRGWWPGIRFQVSGFRDQVSGISGWRPEFRGDFFNDE